MKTADPTLRFRSILERFWIKKLSLISFDASKKLLLVAISFKNIL
ncbi:MAG: hypothetical protein ACK52J_01185 [bacterium]